MELLEIVLLVGGVLCIIASFLVGEKENDGELVESTRSSELTEQEKESIRKQIDAIIEEQIGDVSERTEAKLDKISNTKILELNDYAETIMGEINRNHNETVFLYDMLNEKAKEVKSTVKDVNIVKREVAQVTYAHKTQNDSKASEDKSDKTGESKVEPIKQVQTTGTQAEQLSEAAANVSVKNPSDNSGYSSSGSRDVAKERLIELVKKSTERSREMQAEAHAKVRSAKIEAETELKPAAKTAKTTTKKATTKDSEELKVKTAKTTASKTTKATKKTTKKSSDEDKLKEQIAQIKSDAGASKNDIIIAMHKLGMRNKDIAKEMNLGVGEVKLVIDLFASSK